MADFAALIAGFEREVRFDAHSVHAKVGRSEHGQELRRAGRAALGAIAAHLEATQPVTGPEAIPGVEADVRTAWGLLLRWIGTDVECTRGWPETLGEDMPGWVAWARANAVAG